MSKLRCKCGLPAHVMIKGKPYCLKCAPEPEQELEQEPEQEEESSYSESSSSLSSAEVELQCIELSINKIGPIIKQKKKKPWWEKFLEYSSNQFNNF